MPTEELEDALRNVLARAAAELDDAEQARQRLLRHRYRPTRGRRRAAAGITAVTAAAAVVLGLSLTGVLRPAGVSGPARALGPAADRGPGTIRTMAFTLVEHANGTATLTINLNVLLDPAALQSDLQEDGIPALVTGGRFCSSDPVPAGIQQVLAGPKAPPGAARTFTIDPAALPVGTELSFGNFQLSPGAETAVALIDTGSYTCSSSIPTTAPPPGADLMVVWHPGSPKAAAAKAAAMRSLLRQVGLPRGVARLRVSGR
jgi:hypothetical protein